MSQAQALALAKYRRETASIIEPYSQRDHAWNFDQLYSSNPITWYDETTAPSGYQVTPE